MVGLLICPQVEAVVAIATIVCALALQVLSNLINDLYDFRRGTDKAGRKGFRRALAEGEVTESQMMRAVYLTLAVCLVLGIYLVYIGGWPILLIGGTAILFAWLYTATSKSLSYLGIADIFVCLYYGIIATMGTVWLQAPFANEVYPLLEQGFWAGSVSGLISMGVLMINNLRDIEDDRATGKRTLPVRWGKRAGEVIMLLYAILSPVAAWMAWHSWVPCLIVVPMLALWWQVMKAQGAQYNKCLMMTGLVNVGYVLLVLVES